MQILTLLLQIMISQLEQPNIETEVNALENPETSQQLAQMMTELQNQRTLLEGLIQDRRQVIGNHQIPAGVTTSPQRQTVSRPRSTPAPLTPQSSAAISSAWTLADEEDEAAMLGLDHASLGLNPEEALDSRMPTLPAAAVASARVSRPVSQPLAIAATAAGSLTLAEWGQRVISWGKKHRGKTFTHTMEVDPGYLAWCQPRFNSLNPEMQDFVRFGQMYQARNR